MSTAQLLLVFKAADDPFLESGRLTPELASPRPLAAALPAVEQWTLHFESLGIPTSHFRLGGTAVLAVDSPDDLPVCPPGLPEPIRTIRVDGAHRLGLWELNPGGTQVEIGSTRVGDGGVAVFAGPCAVESRELVLATARAVAEHGAVGLRGGAFKPRTSPYAFQGMQWEGLDILAAVGAEVGLPIVTEVLDQTHVERVAEVADVLQVGARNMQNFALLTAVGRTGRPVVLKRGFGMTLDEFLAASEYVLAAGNDQVILCERGIRTFEHATRFTLDMSAVPLLKRRTHLPVMVDPSHSAGLPELVEPMSLAAVAAGADALLIDAHVQPALAKCDGKQALLPADFGQLMTRLQRIAVALDRVPAGRRLAEPALR